MEKLDLLVAVEHASGTQYLAVEAKLESKEHSGQLGRYDQVIESAGLTPCAKVLLTLDGTPPDDSPGWRPVSYGELRTMLLQARTASGLQNVYLDDFLTLADRLASLVDGLAQPGWTAVYFGRSSHDPDGAAGLLRYVTRMKIGKTLQQCFMRRAYREAVALLAHPPGPVWRVEVEETHGHALLNFQDIDSHILGMPSGSSSSTTRRSYSLVPIHRDTLLSPRPQRRRTFSLA